MQNHIGRLTFSPSDLTNFLASPLVTWMDRYDLENPGVAEPDEASETESILATMGMEHEREYLASLQAEGRDICDLSKLPRSEDRFEATVHAMKDGREVIYQAALKMAVEDAQFVGYADFLIKTAGGPTSGSGLGDYHYEPWDTKLARNEKPKALVQLACYADMLAEIQKVVPKHVHLVLGNKEHKAFRTEDYIYYYRQLQKALLEQQRSWDTTKPPDFVGLEKFGRWTTYAQEKMEKQDHLCRVANIRSIQIKKLNDAGITTMTQLANSSLDRVAKMEQSTFATLKQQARLQIESHGLPKPKYEVLEGKGLAALPPPSPLDVYFDMEGYPLIVGGLEYLFGATVLDTAKANDAGDGGTTVFHDWWAHDQLQERRAFEAFIDWVYARWQKDPAMHIYHYAAYEKSALRRLMSKYATRETEVDELLRHEVMVDLFSIVRQSIRVGEPNYSIKSIEHLYKGKRAGDVATAMESVVGYQRWLAQKDGDDWQSSKVLGDIRAYNKEDCDSTWQLAQWLRGLQKAHGIEWRPKEVSTSDDPSPGAVLRADLAQLVASMLAGISADAAQKTEEMRLQELLGFLLEFHWREAKPVFWAMFDRADMSEEERFEDADCLAGLVRDGSQALSVKQSYWYYYDFDANQDSKIDAGDTCVFADDLKQTIDVAWIDTDNGKVALTRGVRKAPPPERLSLIKKAVVPPPTIAHSIRRIAQALMDGQALPPALQDFLSRSKPRVRGWVDGPLIPPDKDFTAGAMDVISRLENSTLCIQGPPGSGKTYTAAQAIAELLRKGKRVGITSNSHKAIAHLMDKVADVAQAHGDTLRAVKVQSKSTEVQVQNTTISHLESKQLFDGGSGAFSLIGGTAWLFSDERAVGLVDYLFVDEAGQVSIANLVGMAPSTSNIVLMGDQMQLSQPIQGTHPGESGQSVLEYLLQDKQVIPDDFGIFLGTSWRMHPDVCSFISGAVYEGRLSPEPTNETRVIKLPKTQGAVALKPAGILYVPVQHEGNAQESEEEVAVIVETVEELLECYVVDQDGSIRPLTLEDILIVAPYNMQVRRLKTALPVGAKVGSVDKFQGQDAAVVIMSMCSSSGDASPRGLEFIFSKNRLNVAISRAQCLAIVVGSPQLAQTHCNRVEQMELVNLFCRVI